MWVMTSCPPMAITLYMAIIIEAAIFEAKNAKIDC